MTASGAVVNLCAYVLQTSLFLAVGLLIPILFSIRDPRLRYRYWTALLAVSLLLPLLILPLGRPAQGGAGATAYVAGAMTMTAQPGVRAFSPWPWVIGLLATVAAVRLLWIFIGLFRLEWMRRSSPVLNPLPPSLQSAVTHLQVGTEFRVSGAVRSPITFGWRRPVVLLPARFEGLNPEAQRCIALHELLHVKRGDWPVILLEELLRSLLWFHPAVWLVLDRIALSREQVVDREVVRLTHERTAYMNTLAAMARLRQSAGAVAFLPFFHRSHLLQRLALLTKEVSMSKLRLGLTVAGSVAVLLFAGIIATRAFPILGGPYEGLGAKPYAVAVTAHKDPDSPKRFYYCEAMITDTATGEVVCAPRIGVPAGEKASIESTNPDGRIFLLSVLIHPDGTTVSYHFVAKNGTTVFQDDEGLAKVGTAPPVAPIPDEDGVYPMGSLPMPKAINPVSFPYPPEAKEKGIGGKVAVQIVINERGEATQAKVLRSDNEIFNATALHAASQMLYEPPMLGGHPVKVYWIININFKLDK